MAYRIISTIVSDDGSEVQMMPPQVLGEFKTYEEAVKAYGRSSFLLEEIAGHLGAAICQSIPGDDQIIMDHVRTAHEYAKRLRGAA